MSNTSVKLKVKASWELQTETSISQSKLQRKLWVIIYLINQSFPFFCWIKCVELHKMLYKCPINEAWACTPTVPVLRFRLISSACKSCECVVARDRGVGQLAMPVEQFTSAPQKIRLSVSSKSLHCTFIQRAWREKKTQKMRTSTSDSFVFLLFVEFLFCFLAFQGRFNHFLVWF